VNYITKAKTNQQNRWNGNLKTIKNIKAVKNENAIAKSLEKSNK